MRWVMMGLAMMACMVASGQPAGGDEDIMRFLGTESPEEVDEEDAGFLSSLLSRPLKINRASPSRLVSSGIFSRYQALSLADYRQRHGDVLSLMELSLVDGFGMPFAERIAPFISFDSALRPGQSPEAKMRPRTDITIRGGLKHNSSLIWGSALKAHVESGRRLDVSLGLSSPYGHFEADRLTYTTSVIWNMEKVPCEILFGDFNARFGQGLILRNGISLSTLSSPYSLMKNPAGLSGTSSFTGASAFTGAGCETSFRNFTLTGFLALPGIKEYKSFKDDLMVMPAFNLSWFSRYGQVGLTHYAVSACRLRPDPEESGMWSSLDTRWCLNGCDLFAEAAYDWKTSCPAALAGVIFPLGSHARMAVAARWYPELFKPYAAGAYGSGTMLSNEYGVTLSSEAGNGRTGTGSHRIVLTADAAHFPKPKKDDRGGSMQLKGQLVWEWKPLSFLNVKTRLVERIRTWGILSRTDVRTDLVADFGSFNVSVRLNALNCSGWGLLSYIEGGYKARDLSVCLRQGFFRIDDWQDRIYVYERDAPGTFNVPAYYGRGLWTAMAGSVRFSGWGRIYVRAAYTAYPFMPPETRKPGRAELKVQSVFSF